MKKLFSAMSDALYHREDIVLVSIVSSSGSTPRGAGAKMLVGKTGRLAGTIGGGAVEFYCIRQAQQMLGKKSGEQASIALNKEENAQLGMVCGGHVDVHFLPVSGGDEAMIDLCRDAAERFTSAKPFWLLTPLQSGAVPALWPMNFGAERWIPAEVTANLPAEPVVRKANNESWFCEQIQQAGVVYIFGGGHVAQALAPVLAPLDFACVILENREEFAQSELFPTAQSVKLIDFTNIGESVQITPDDYICIMTRGHADDLLVETQVLHSPARYIGVIGSARKTAATFMELRRRGFTDRDLSRIVAPIGVPLGGRSPAEIAISVAAQLIQYRSSLRRDFPFHEQEESL